MSTILNNFPEGLRGTFFIKDDDEQKVSDKLLYAKKLINRRSEGFHTLLVHCEMRGSGWVILWWPANEPRHEVSDEILTGDVHYGRP